MTQPAPPPDPGNSDPSAFAVDLPAADLAEALDRVDNPDPIVTAGLAGLLYDPEYTGPGYAGEEVDPDGE